MRQWTVDAFATRPFMGNVAAVLEPLEAWPEAAWMQALAGENKHAETAFLLRTADPARFGLRWFTPTVEVPLCGHATLAAAHVLWTETGVAADGLGFDTRSGVLTVRRRVEGYEMDFPRDPIRRTVVPDGLGRALGAEPVEAWAGRYLMAVMADAATVRALTPDASALMAFQHGAMERGQVVACAASDDACSDVVDRFFGPGCGLAEDAATGSARAGLTALFADRVGRPVVRFEQAYPGRGAYFECELAGDRVLIRGQAVTVMESLLRL